MRVKEISAPLALSIDIGPRKDVESPPMTKESLVIQLQRECLDRQTYSTLDVLRKALVVAKKLDVTDFQEWIERELKGYGPGDDIPKYRVVKGELKARNPYRGWIPVVFDNT